MCAVSYVADLGKDWTDTNGWDWWKQPNYDDYQELIRKARKWDELTNQPDCVDEEKDKFLKELDARMKKLEEGTRD